MYSNAFALAGRTSSLHHTQGDALGYVLIALAGRSLNACAYSLIQLAKRESITFDKTGGGSEMQNENLSAFLLHFARLALSLPRKKLKQSMKSLNLAIRLSSLFIILRANGTRK